MSKHHCDVLVVVVGSRPGVTDTSKHPQRFQILGNNEKRKNPQTWVIKHNLRQGDRKAETGLIVRMSVG